MSFSKILVFLSELLELLILKLLAYMFQFDALQSSPVIIA